MFPTDWRGSRGPSSFGASLQGWRRNIGGSSVPRLLDYLERIFVAALSIPFVIAFASVLTLHPQYLLIAASELLAVVFILTRRRGDVAMSPYAFFIAIVGTSLPLLIR